MISLSSFSIFVQSHSVSFEVEERKHQVASHKRRKEEKIGAGRKGKGDEISGRPFLCILPSSSLIIICSHCVASSPYPLLHCQPKKTSRWLFGRRVGERRWPKVLARASVLTGPNFSFMYISAVLHIVIIFERPHFPSLKLSNGPIQETTIWLPENARFFLTVKEVLPPFCLRKNKQQQ